MKKLLLLFTISFISTALYSQTKISGSITDVNNSPLPGANIYIKDSYDGVSSLSDGTFSFITEETGEQVLVMSYVGYKTIEEKVQLSGKEIIINFVMMEDAGELNAVVISAGSFEASDEKKAVILRPLDIVTTAGATADIYGVMNTLPGTQIVGETEGLFVRGGSASETKTIIDELIVYNPFFSRVPDLPSRGRFSPFLFKGTIFSTGGYSAQYGQALSSALILRTDDLAPETQSAVNIMAVGLGGSHTQRWENTSLSFEGGYYNLGPYFNILKQRTEWDRSPRTGEGILSFRHKLSKTGMFKVFTTYNYSDLSLFQKNLSSPGIKDHFALENKNLYLNTSYRDVIADEWSVYSGLSYSRDIDLYNISSNIIKSTDESRHGKITISKSIFDGSFITFGGEIQNLILKDGFNQYSRKLEEVYSGIFIESDIFVTQNFAVRLGLRGERSNILNKQNIAPRTSLAYKVGKYSQFNFAYGKFYQTPEKEYLLETTDLGFEKADHYILNFQYIAEEITFRIEAYYKDYRNLVKGISRYSEFIPVNQGTPLNPDISNKGKGFAKGIDIFWRDKETIPYVDYWISYTYLDTKRDYKDFPVLASPVFTTPHTFSIVYKQWIIPINSSLGLTYTFATGRPYYNPNNSEFLGDKTKNYNNLSLNISYVMDLFGNFTVIYFSVDNILGNNNIFGYRYSPDGKIKEAVVPPALRSPFLGVFISLGGNQFSE